MKTVVYERPSDNDFGTVFGNMEQHV